MALHRINQESLAGCRTGHVRIRAGAACPSETADARRRRIRGGSARAGPGRAAARRQLPAEPRDVLHDLGVAGGPATDAGLGRQEHDRQGRVSADRGDRVALRPHHGRSLALAQRRVDDRLFDDRLERGGDARRAGAQVAVAQATRSRRRRPSIDPISSAGRSRSAGRSSRATSTSSCARSRSRAMP